MKRRLHLDNMGRAKADWFGVVGYVNGTLTYASVAYRTSTNVLVGRVTGTGGATYAKYSAAVSSGEAANGVEHKSCPETAGGGAFTFYGYNAATTDYPNGVIGGHVHSCTWYVPDFTLSGSGYAINDETTIAMSWSWPNLLPDHLKDCPIDPALIRKLTNQLWKDAGDTTGYGGAPHQTVEDGDSRPGDTTVGDLVEQAGDTTTWPDPDPETAEPTTTTPPGSTTVDLGPDPNVGAPTLDDPPTGIMDPIFAWLPDLPSITLDTNNSECPVWAVNMTEFFGPQGQWLIESHCPLLETNRAAIGALMVALFGLGAAMIILRA